MANQQIFRGATPNDNTGDNLREGARKINENFTELYRWIGGGSGTTITATQKGQLTLGQLADTAYINAGGVNAVTNARTWAKEQVLQWNGTSWTPTDKLSGNVVGHLIPESGNTYNIGAKDHEVNDLWIGANTYFQPDALRLFSDPATPGLKRLKLQTSEDRTFTVLIDCTTNQKDGLSTPYPGPGLRIQGTDTLNLDQANCISTTIGATTFYSLPGLDLTSGPLYKFLGNIVPTLTLNGNTYPHQPDPALRGGTNPDCWYISAINQITLADGAGGNIVNELDSTTPQVYTLKVETEAIEGIGQVVVDNLSQTLKNKTIIAANNNIVMNIDDLHDVDTSSNVAWQGASLMYDANTHLWAPGNAATGGGIGGTVIGSLIPGTSNVYSLGTATHRFTDLWLTASTLHIGDVAISDGGSGISINKPMVQPTERVIFAHRYQGWSEGNLAFTQQYVSGEEYLRLTNVMLGVDPDDPMNPATSIEVVTLGGNTYFSMPGVDGTSGVGTSGPYDLDPNHELSITVGNSTFSKTYTYLNDVKGANASANNHTDGPVWLYNDALLLKVGRINSDIYDTLSTCSYIDYEIKETYPQSGGDAVSTDGTQELSNKTFAGETFMKGDFVPTDDELYSLGTPTRKWKEIHVSGSTIYFGDSSISSSPEGIKLSAPLAPIEDKTLYHNAQMYQGNYNDADFGQFQDPTGLVADQGFLSEEDLANWVRDEDKSETRTDMVNLKEKSDNGMVIDGYIKQTIRDQSVTPTTKWIEGEVIYDKKFGVIHGDRTGSFVTKYPVENMFLNGVARMAGDLIRDDARYGETRTTAYIRNTHRPLENPYNFGQAAWNDTSPGNFQELLSRPKVTFETYSIKDAEIPGITRSPDFAVIPKGHSRYRNEVGYFHEIELYKVFFVTMVPWQQMIDGYRKYKGNINKWVGWKHNVVDLGAAHLVAKINMVPGGSQEAERIMGWAYNDRGVDECGNMCWWESVNSITMREGKGWINKYVEENPAEVRLLPNGTAMGHVLQFRVKVRKFPMTERFIPIVNSLSHQKQEKLIADGSTDEQWNHGFYADFYAPNNTDAKGIPLDMRFGINHPTYGDSDKRSKGYYQTAWKDPNTHSQGRYLRNFQDPVGMSELYIKAINPSKKGDNLTSEGEQTLKNKTLEGTILAHNLRLEPTANSVDFAIGASPFDMRVNQVYTRTIDVYGMRTNNLNNPNDDRNLQWYDIHHGNFLIPDDIWQAYYCNSSKYGNETGTPKPVDGRGKKGMMYTDGNHLYICTGPSAGDSTKWAWVRTQLTTTW